MSIIQQQVDELSHFKMIHSNRRMAGERDHQIGLFRLLQIDIPDRNAINLTIYEHRSAQIGSNQACPPQMCSTEIGMGEVGSTQISLAQICLSEVCLTDISLTQVCSSERGPS